MKTHHTTLYQATNIRGLISAILLFGPLLFGQTGVRSEPFELRVVTLHQLQHKVPRASRQEMEKADKARLKHRRDDEVEHLRNALRIDPENVSARNNLAICLLENDPASAIAQLEQAINIDPHEAYLFHNVAIGYVINHQLDAGERAARTAVGLDRSNTRARTVLGAILVLEHKYTAEALADLEPESQQFPVVGLLAADALMNRHELSKARSYVDAYLSSGEQGYRDYAERWLHYIDQNLTTSAATIPSPTPPLPR